MPNLPVKWFDVKIVWKRRKRLPYVPVEAIPVPLEEIDETSDLDVWLKTYKQETKTLREDERNRLYADWKAYQAVVANPSLPPTTTQGGYLVVNIGMREQMQIDFKEVETLEFEPEKQGFKGPSHYDSCFVDMEYAGLR